MFYRSDRILHIPRCVVDGRERPRSLVRFEGFELDLRAGELRHNGSGPVRLSEQPFRILTALVEHPGEVVLREELRKTLWPNDTIVEFEHSINAAIKRLRQALEDSAENPRFIETLPRRGYRWMVPVQRVEAAPALPLSPDVASAEAEPFGSNLIGKKVSHYRVLEMLGGGGMGVVYKAEDLKLGRRVALKFLPEELRNDPAALNRFEREARAASALSHPNICTIHGVEQHEQNPFIVMELLDGETLREMISWVTPGKPPLGLDKLLDVSIQISEALDAAHRQGIMHRDIKPANIFITKQGQAKILDFGLAKISPVETAAGSNQTPRDDGSTHGTSGDPAPLATSDLYLSRTGLAMGTAAYMSPEQARGEKLDVRTDLFSFGLVLYEMATGQRAFKGDTGPVLHEAILKHLPTPAQQLNPQLPAKLEEIIHRALEKDREARYQSAAELSADLRNLKQERPPRLVAGRWAIAAGVVAVLLIASAIFWFGRIRPPSGQSPPELKLRQLTTNSFENPVTSGGISPDGKYLAYSDTKGLYVKLIEKGETRAVPLPEEFKDQNVGWQWAAWFADSTGFIANAYRSGLDQSQWDSNEASIWMASVLGGAPQKLRDNAIAWSVSQDGTLISFGTNKGKFGEREIWLMGPSGDHARRLFDTDEDSYIFGLSWSSNGKRVLYGKTDKAGDTLLSRDLNSGPPISIFGPSQLKNVNDFLWLADGRLLYSVAEPGSFVGSSCNFWEMRLDGRTGKPVETPRRLTNWSGFCMSSASTTADGKKLAFLRWSPHATSYVADLVAGGTRILQPKHFPLIESSEIVADWAPDSRSVILVSNRSGNFGLYTQSVDKETAEPLVTEGYHRDPHMSPDGKSVIYLGTGEKELTSEKPQELVMRVPITGGPSRLLFIASSDSLLTCARSPSNLCAIGEATEDGKQLTVSIVDPVKGRGPELFRIGLNSREGLWTMSVSPDGSRFAVLLHRESPIYIYSPRGELLAQVPVKGWNNLDFVIWAADGKSLFVTATTRDGSAVLHVDPQGNACTLWEYTGGRGETIAHPSPDGRRLEFDTWTNNANMWLMENF